MIHNRSYLDLSEEEIEKASKLTPSEQAAVDAFISAAKALPKSLTVSLFDYGPQESGISIYKRITQGSGQEVAKLKKRSLIL